MRLFDTHCHLDFSPFSDDITHHLNLAQQQAVVRLLIPSIGASNWETLDKLAKQYASIYYALGIHPYFIDGQSLADLTTLEQRLTNRSEHCVAVGECGLDAMIEMDLALQERLFVRQIELAQSFQLPLILHARKTHNRLIQLLKKHRFTHGGVLHGFSGSYQQAMQFVEIGFYIGVGGVITYPRANKTRLAIAQLPLDALVLETDSPDMPLMNEQGKPNHPQNLSKILRELALLKNTSTQTIAENVWKNSNLAFNICE